ncbi:MAG: NACHT domain-containing protein, partial [Acidobacteriota bacterium]
MTLAELVLPVLLGPVVEDLYTDGSATIRRALEREPLRRPLRTALEQAEQGFQQSLEVSGFTLDEQARADLAEMFRDEAVIRAVGELPFRPIGAIDTTRCRQLFAAMGPTGAEAADFDAAWQAMGRRFQKAAARSDELRALLELTRLDAATEHQQISAESLGKIEELLSKILERIEAGGPVQDEALAEYREWFYESYRYVDTRGLFMRSKERPGEGIELRDVFVETLLAPADRERRAGKGREGDRRLDPRRRLASELEELDGPEPDLGDPATEDPGRLQPPAEPRRIGRVLTRAESAGPGVPIVILGPPGSGKSTLMRCLGMAICNPEARPDLLDPGGSGRRVPILCELKRFASRLASTPDQRLLPYLVEQLQESLPAVEDLLRRGEALVLLDGLDEVFDDHHRRWVSEQVWELVTRFQTTRFVLTSRPYGYHAAPLPGRTDRWDLEPFGDDGIRSFFRGWFAALQREGIDAGVRGDGREKADGLTEQVLSRPRIREMAENPMLCTLIVLVQRSRTGPLPQRRIEFYDAAVRTLAENWEQAKHRPKQETAYDFPEPELILKALAEVAWRAFHELERREIPEATLRTWLREVLADHPDWAGARGRRAIDDFLEVVRDRTGLLVEAGGDRYQFVHLSLHEHLASQFILDRLDQEQSTRVLLHHLHTPEWEEVLRLTVSGAGQARAEHLLRAVLARQRDRARDPAEAEIEREIEARIHRDLRFLGRCLG